MAAVEHLGSSQETPDYDWEAQIEGLPATAVLAGERWTPIPEKGILIDNADGVLGVCDNSFSTANYAAGKSFRLLVCQVDVAVCEPEEDSWRELDASRVILDDEPLRVKVSITPQIESFADCKRFLGRSLTVKTAGTCPEGASVAFSEADEFLTADGSSEIHMVRTRAQLAACGLLPARDEDGVDEMAWIDIAETDVQDLSDSEAFSRLGYRFRGKATSEKGKTLDSEPPNSPQSESFFKAAGCEIITVAYGGTTSRRRQIMNQCDVFYISGHGSHSANRIQGLFTPDMAGAYWGRDLDCLILAGCSLLDVNDYNGHYSGAEHSLSPGKAWAQTGPSIFSATTSSRRATVAGRRRGLPRRGARTVPPRAMSRRGWTQTRRTMPGTPVRLTGIGMCTLEDSCTWYDFGSKSRERIGDEAFCSDGPLGFSRNVRACLDVGGRVYDCGYKCPRKPCRIGGCRVHKQLG